MVTRGKDGYEEEQETQDGVLMRRETRIAYSYLDKELFSEVTYLTNGDAAAGTIYSGSDNGRRSEEVLTSTAKGLMFYSAVLESVCTSPAPATDIHSLLTHAHSKHAPRRRSSPSSPLPSPFIPESTFS